MTELIYSAERNLGRVEVKVFRRGKLFGKDVGTALLVPVHTEGVGPEVCWDLKEGELHNPVLLLTEKQARYLAEELLGVNIPRPRPLELRPNPPADYKDALIDELWRSHRLLLDIVERQLLSPIVRHEADPLYENRYDESQDMVEGFECDEDGPAQGVDS